MSSLEIKKVYTENPYADELIYFTKKLGIDTILKNEQEALKHETKESLKAGSLYVMCKNNRATLTSFDELDRDSVRAALDESGEEYDLYDFYGWCADPSTLDTNSIYYKIVLNAQKQYYIDNYVELNDYYRMLYGLPPVDAEPVYLTANYMTGETSRLDATVPIHEMDAVSLAIMKYEGVIQAIYEEDPENRKWMLYLDRKIDPYYSRKADKFSVLYIPDVDCDSVTYMYKERLDINRTYAMRVIYSEAYKYNSDYYDSFISIFIVLNTMMDIIARINEFIARKEIFDIRSCKYLFESYGIEFFEEIPLRYQIKLVKNIHMLLKYKSTTKCMVTIHDIFGIESIEIFKYYLLKDKTVDLDDLTFPDDKLSHLKFVKIPLQATSSDEYLRDRTNYLDYDTVTEPDMCWDGGLEHRAVKEEVLDLEFNYTRTKYYSVNNTCDMYKMTNQVCYFLNMLYDNKILEDQLKIKVPYISADAEFRLSDIFTFIFALTYQLNGVKDLILDTQGKTLYVYGFNFNADIQALLDYFAEPTHRVEYIDDALELLQQFQFPDGEFTNIEDFLNLLTSNLDLLDQILDGMWNVDNYRQYKVWEKIYNALYILQLSMDYYIDPETGDFYRDVDGDATYTEFLRQRDSLLYLQLLDIINYDGEYKDQYVAKIADGIVYALEEYMDSEEFQYLINLIPTYDKTSLLRYVYLVINFFKSYKIELLGYNVNYIIDDKRENVIRLLDNEELRITFTKTEFLNMYDLLINSKTTMSKSEALDLMEKLYLDVSRWHRIDLHQKQMLLDRIQEIIISLGSEEHIVPMMIQDSLTAVYDDTDVKHRVSLVDGIAENNTTMTGKEGLDLIESMFIVAISDSE